MGVEEEAENAEIEYLYRSESQSRDCRTRGGGGLRGVMYD